jgi:hypothetical protein
LALASFPVCATAQPSRVELDIRGGVNGLLAATSYDITFANDDIVRRQETARFVATHAVAAGLTLWVNGKPRQAAIVARDRAERAYQDIVQGRRDPALLIDEGNGRFRLSVFPVPPEGTLRVRVSFLHPLLPADKESTWNYQPPEIRIDGQRRVDRLGIEISVETAGDFEVGASKAYDFDDELLNSVTQRITYSQNDAPVPATWRIPLRARRPISPAIAGRATQDETFFAAVLPTPATNRNLPAPHVTFILDASTPVGDMARARSLLAAAIGHLPSDAKCSLLLAGLQPTWLTDQPVEPEACLALVKRMPPDRQPAANVLGALRQAIDAMPATQGVRHILLLSPGWDPIATPPHQDPALYEAMATALEKPDLCLHTVTTGPLNFAMASLAKHSGGTGMHLVSADTASTLGESFATSLTKAHRAQCRGGLQAAAVDDSLNVRELARLDLSDERCLLVGRFTGKGTLRTTFGDNADSAANIRLTQPARRHDATLLSRLHAGLYTRHLWANLLTEGPDIATAAEIVSRCRENNVLAAPLAMLVLETRADYRRFSIPLPPDLASAEGEEVAPPANLEWLREVQADAEALESEGAWQEAGSRWHVIAEASDDPADAIRAEACDLLHATLTLEIEALRPIAADLRTALESMATAGAEPHARGPADRVNYGSITDDEWKILQRMQLPLPAMKVGEGIPLRDMAHWLTEISGVPVRLDTEGLRTMGITDTEPVTLSLPNGTTLRDVLDAIQQSLGGSPPWTAYMLCRKHVLITVPGRPREQTMTRVYYIGDLLDYYDARTSPSVVLSDAQDADGEWHGSSRLFGSVGPEHAGTPPQAGGVAAPVRDASADLYDPRDVLIRMPLGRDLVRPSVHRSAGGLLQSIISENIDPFTWRPEGDTGSIYRYADLLVIHQSRATHEHVARLLAALRRQICRTPSLGLLDEHNRLKPWVLMLVSDAAGADADRQKTLPVRTIAGRKFVRVGGLWIDATAHRDLSIVILHPEGDASRRLLKCRPELKAFADADAPVLVRLSDDTAVCWGPAGIVSASHPRLVELLAAADAAAPDAN